MATTTATDGGGGDGGCKGCGNGTTTGVGGWVDGRKERTIGHELLGLLGCCGVLVGELAREIGHRCYLPPRRFAGLREKKEGRKEARKDGDGK
jgi:hypothetical protein